MMMHRNPRGYSLLELIVSLGLFSMVMLVVIGAYLTLISLDRQARASNQLAASLSFAVESMARNLRTGSDYACNGNTASPNCTSTSGGTSIVFTDSESQRITYLRRSDGSIGQCIGLPCNAATAVPLTDRRITIDALRFYVRGVGTGDNRQPQVTFVVSGTMTTDAGESTSFTIQTGATQRYIEL